MNERDNSKETTPITSGVSLIAAERQRQIEDEKWDSGHDDEHDEEQLALAGASYALPSYRRIGYLYDRSTPDTWPWEKLWWKPTPDDRVRELVKAGALIAAEIDRLQRRSRDGHG
jgi:hypothetical protein